MYNPEEFKENKAESGEVNINELLNKEKTSLEVSELIKNNDYLLKALEEISKKLNNYQLKHVLNTAERTNLIAKGFLDDDQLKLLLKAALVHDVGKAEDDDISEIINRGERLSEDERLKIKDHIGLMVDWGKKIVFQTRSLQWQPVIMKQVEIKIIVIIIEEMKIKVEIVT